MDLPDAASLRFFAPAASQVQDIAGARVNASVERNREGGARGEAADIYWSPFIPGDTVTLEIDIPEGLDPGQVSLALPRLSHFFRWPLLDKAAPSVAASCQQDVSCHPEWDLPSRATAMLLYTDETGGSGACTGTLLNDSDPATHIPYFWTAHHCVPDQVRASSLETYWFYRSDRCGGTYGDVQAVTGGADLLYGGKSTDTAFLRLRQPPPAGAVFSVWSADLPAPDTPVAGLHHPLGERQTIAFGKIMGYLPCGEIHYCANTGDPEALNFMEVGWQQGVTEPGGSGSGLFLPAGQLVGTLSGGYSRCEEPRGAEDYGRFDIPYRDGLHKWLGAAASAPN